MGKEVQRKHPEEQCEKTQELDQNTTLRKSSRLRRNKITKPLKQDNHKKQAPKRKPPPKHQLKVEDVPVQYICHSQDDFICSICLNYIVRAVSGPCGHSYCELCIQQYLLFFEECSKCFKKLRNVKLSYNINLDSMIEDYVEHNDKDQLPSYKIRQDKWKDWNSRRRPTNVEVGMQVDVRDSNYIWCRGTIYRILCKFQQNRTKYAFITYEGKDKRYNEQICQLSPRLAPLNFYTSRTDIPKYISNEQGMFIMKGFVQLMEEGRNYLISSNLQDF